MSTKTMISVGFKVRHQQHKELFSVFSRVNVIGYMGEALQSKKFFLKEYI